MTAELVKVKVAYVCAGMSDDGEEEAEEELGPNLGVSYYINQLITY